MRLQVQYGKAGRVLNRIWQRLRCRLCPPARPSARILVVRGSRMAAEMARVLKGHGLVVDLVDRAAVLECARRTGPALIVSDLAMSRISEMEDALCLRQFLPASKLLLFSAHGLRQTSLPPESEPELVRTIERLCNDPQKGHMLWLDLARLVQVQPRQKSVAA